MALTPVKVKVAVPTRGGILIEKLKGEPHLKVANQPGRFMFGIIIGGPYNLVEGKKGKNIFYGIRYGQAYIVRWDGKQHKTSLLPAECLHFSP